MKKHFVEGSERNGWKTVNRKEIEERRKSGADDAGEVNHFGRV